MNSHIHPKHIFPIFAGMIVLAANTPCGAADSTEVAMALGNVLGSEKFCGLHYDQEAIKAFINKHVNEDDMEFTSTLAMSTRVQQRQNQEMSPSLKTAQCEQTARVARAYGFIK